MKWLLLAVAVVWAARFGQLYLRWLSFRAAGREAERNLLEAAARIRDFATRHLERLPDSLDNLPGEPARGVAYRPAPRLTLDGRLVVLHDDQPTHKLLQFPHLRDGRGVVLCSGRVLFLTEEAFEKLIQADDTLRQKLGLACVTGG